MNDRGGIFGKNYGTALICPPFGLVGKKLRLLLSVFGIDHFPALEKIGETPRIFTERASRKDMAASAPR